MLMVNCSLLHKVKDLTYGLQAVVKETTQVRFELAFTQRLAVNTFFSSVKDLDAFVTGHNPVPDLSDATLLASAVCLMHMRWARYQRSLSRSSYQSSRDRDVLI